MRNPRGHETNPFSTTCPTSPPSTTSTPMNTARLIKIHLREKPCPFSTLPTYDLIWQLNIGPTPVIE